ncbi:MAG: hypothetical protein ACJ79R_01780 [Anaeromyxobacteraceae bacterium]
MQRPRSEPARHLTVVLAAALCACGGAPGAPPPATSGGSPPPPAAPAANPAAPVSAASGTAPAGGPPGTNGLSSLSGNSALQVGAGSGLTYVDRPAPGEPSVKGLVLVNGSGVRQAPTAPPPDTVVTLNGVALVHAVVDGTTSDRFFQVDPAGPQPTIAQDGYLHITASSDSLGASRTLSLACPFDLALTTTPAPGASLAGTSALSLAWTDDLPQQPPGTLLPASGAPAATLYPYDAKTGAVGAALLTVFVDQHAHAATVPVRPAPDGYLLELRYPALVFLDGVTGGYCGRTKRVTFSP